MYINNLDEVVHKLEDKLEEYLQSFGINTSSNFSCISPDHEDKNPSCSIQGNNKKTFHCLGCGCSGNIFQAANLLEDKPISGAAFVNITVPYLAEKFGIEVDKREPTEAELYEIDTFRAYAAASEYITNAPKNKLVTEALKERDWSESICRELNIGTIDSFKGFRDHLKGLGFAASFLDEIDLGRRKRGTQLFSETNLIFTIKDEHGRPVGFASRNLEYNPNDKQNSKYVNQATTGLKCNIYKKGSRLYNVNKIIKEYKKNPQPIWIFEGYGDVATAKENGLNNCVALGGLSFTQEQLFLLKEHGFFKYILAFDGDDAGQNKMADVLDKLLGGHKDVDIKIIVIPENKDPDQFIREEGLNSFLELEQWNAFEWRLMQFAEDEDEAICAAMVPLIVNEPNCIKQDKMSRQLAQATGIELNVISQEVNRLQNEREHIKARERKDILDKMWNKIQRSPTDAELFMTEASGCLYDLMRQYNKESLSVESYLSRLQQQKIKQENKGDEFSGFILGKDLEILQNVLNGEWRQDVFCLVAAKANAGKTSFLVKLGLNLATHPENNAIVIYHSIDDTLEQLLPKFVSVAEGTRGIELNEVINPNYYAKTKPEILEKRLNGYKKLEELARQNLLIIKDSNDGKSLAFIESVLRYYRDKFPEKNIVFILDNFHKLKDLAQADAGTQAYKTMSEKMKGLSGKYHAAVICTAEYHKMEYGSRPTNNNLSSTVQLEYDANLVLHFYNELHEKGDKASDYHISKKDGRLIKLPRIEIICGKNKITDFKGKLYANFYPAHSEFVMIDYDVVESERENNKGDSGPQYPTIM